MTESITSLFYELDNVSDQSNEGELRRMVAAWRGRTEIKVIREVLAEWLATSADVAKLSALARETSTHYVWPLHLTDKGYGVTVNEFKDPRDIITGYATVLHNHRYSFISVMLSGEYTQVRSHVDLLTPHQAAQVRDLGEEIVKEGDIVAVNHEEFHRLRTISSNTVTLVVKCPAVKSESLSVDTSTLIITKHVPVEARVRQLITALAPVINNGGENLAGLSRIRR